MTCQAERILDEKSRTTPASEETQRTERVRETTKLVRKLREIIQELRSDFIGIFMPTGQRLAPKERMTRYTLARDLAKEVMGAADDLRDLEKDLERLNGRAQKFAEAQGIDF